MAPGLLSVTGSVHRSITLQFVILVIVKLAYMV